MSAPDPDRQLILGLRAMPQRDNAYTARNREILGRLGEVRDAPRARELARTFLARLITLRRRKIYDVLIIGWAENVLTQWGDGLSRRGVLEFRVYLWLCRQLSGSVIYVRHNELPHNTPDRDRAAVTSLIEAGERRADAVVAHSPVYAEAHRCHYVPHPLYAVAPAAGDKVDEYVVFGRIQPYKNIGRLIEAWSGPATLAVIGPCRDEQYLGELRALARDKPVTFDVGFQDEGKVAARISRAAGVIIANEPGSVIVSGTFFFAMSCGARVFAIGTPFLDWVATTPLAMAVEVFASVPALVDGIHQGDSGDGPSAAKIRREADKLFSDQSVAAAWQAVFDAMADDAGEKARAPG